LMFIRVLILGFTCTGTSQQRLGEKYQTYQYYG